MLLGLIIESSLDLKKVNIKELISSFNVDTSSDKAMNYWISWFNRRFKHVLLNSITARVNTKIDCSLTELDKLQAETKLEYLKIAAFPDGPYSETVNPFGGPELTATREIVDAYVKDAEAIIRKDMKDPTKPINVATTNEYSKNYAESINNPISKPKTKQEIEAKNIANMPACKEKQQCSLVDGKNTFSAKYQQEPGVSRAAESRQLAGRCVYFAILRRFSDGSGGLGRNQI